MYNAAASPTVANCTFSGNEASYGGGMYNSESAPTVTSSAFSDNSATGDGGGMCNEAASPTVRSCTFSGNEASYGGGGMSNGQSSAPTVESCVFSGNSASVVGGGMRNNSGTPAVTNCTFHGNSSSVFGGGIGNTSSSAPVVTNCILWGDTAPNGPEIMDVSSTSTVTYSNVEGGFTGDGNIDADPLFVGAPDDLHIGEGSPCIDAANGDEAPEFDMDGHPRVDDLGTPDSGVGDPPYADLGAYEYLGFTCAPAGEACEVDLDGPGGVEPVLTCCDWDQDDGDWVLVSHRDTEASQFLINHWAALEPLLESVWEGMEVRYEVHTSQDRVYKQYNQAVAIHGNNHEDTPVWFGTCKLDYADAFAGDDWMIQPNGGMPICFQHVCATTDTCPNWQNNVHTACHRSLRADDGSLFRAEQCTYYPSWDAYCGGLLKHAGAVYASGCAVDHDFEVVGPEGQYVPGSYHAYVGSQTAVKIWLRSSTFELP